MYFYYKFYITNFFITNFRLLSNFMHFVFRGWKDQPDTRVALWMFSVTTLSPLQIWLFWFEVHLMSTFNRLNLLLSTERWQCDNDSNGLGRLNNFVSDRVECWCWCTFCHLFLFWLGHHIACISWFNYDIHVTPCWTVMAILSIDMTSIQNLMLTPGKYFYYWSCWLTEVTNDSAKLISI